MKSSFFTDGWVIHQEWYGVRPGTIKYKFPIKVEAGVIVEINGERHLALAKTKVTPIGLSHCRACSLFRKPVCELLKCENIRFEKVPAI